MSIQGQVSNDGKVLGIPVDGNPSAVNDLMVWDSVTNRFKFIPNTAGNVPNGTAAGDIIYWNGAAWVLLPAGAANQLLQTGVAPSWVSKVDMPAGIAAGDIVYYNGAAWVRLAAGTGNQILKTGVAPSWIDNIVPITAGHSAQSCNNTAGIRYLGAIGISGASTAENDAKNVCPMTGTLRNARVIVNANANTAAGTLTLRKGGVSQALVITITALTTGVFTDVTNTVAIVAGDLIDWEASVAVTGNSTQNGIVMELLL